MPLANATVAADDRGARDRAGPRTAPPDGDDADPQFLPVRKLRQQYIDYLTTKSDEIEEQQEARRYYHGAHWTEEQIRVLRNRHQPPMTWNRIGRKVNGIVGLVERMRFDPKAAPRTPKSEPGAEIATQSIRYVLDANQWKEIDPWCLLQCGIDGVAGTQMVLRQGDQGDMDVGLHWVIGDEYFYDPKAYRLDLEDKGYEGISKWLDIERAVELFPDKEELLRGLVEGDSDLTTSADRDYKWVITASSRIRLVEHWYKHRGKWCWGFYVSTVLIDQGVSPFYDERGQSCSSFDMFRCAVDQDGDSYGFIRNLKGPQDALNQGKSKTLHIANTKLVHLEKGAVDDVETVRREVMRPDGTVETNPGFKFEIVDTKQDLAVFNGFTEDAKAELDGFANSNLAAISGAGIANVSGRTIELLRQPGMAELGPFILSYRGWKLRVYRKIWNAVQRYWTAERWIRVTGNDGLGQFIQLNGLGVDAFGRPTIVNAVGALDVDVILEEGPDVASMMAETGDRLAQYPPGTIPPIVLIEMSSLPRSEKNRIIQLMMPKPPPPNPVQQMAQRLQLEGMAADVAQKGATVRKTHAQADQSLATADEKRAKVGHLAASAHLDAAEFARDTLAQAHEIAQQAAQPAQPAPPSGASPPQSQPL